MNDDPNESAGSGTIWKRGLFMLLFALIYQLAVALILFAVVFQFAHVLATTARNQRVLELGQGLAAYVYQILRFLTFNTERLPFPFSRWPHAGDGNP